MIEVLKYRGIMKEFFNNKTTIKNLCEDKIIG